eukprot:4764690-Lingulodinium_polyedra.AAC.1
MKEPDARAQAHQAAPKAQKSTVIEEQQAWRAGARRCGSSHRRLPRGASSPAGMPRRAAISSSTPTRRAS